MESLAVPTAYTSEAISFTLYPEDNVCKVTKIGKSIILAC
jgi:hypothetical protein